MIIKIKNKLHPEQFIENKSVESVAIRNNPRIGFTLIEILIVVFLVGIILVVILPLGVNFLEVETLDTTADEVLHNLRRARERASFGENSSSYGVFFEEDRYTVFRGNSYAGRDPVFDEVYLLPSGLGLSSTPFAELVFRSPDGLPSPPTSSIRVLRDARHQEILVNPEGRVSFKGPWFFSFVRVDGGGWFANPGNVLGQPDGIFGEGGWNSGGGDKENEHTFSGLTNEGHTGSIERVELLLKAYTGASLVDDRGVLTVVTPTGSVPHTIPPSAFNEHIGAANVGDITIDVTGDYPWTMNDLSLISLTIVLEQIGSREIHRGGFFLDSIGIRVTFQ